MNQSVGLAYPRTPAVGFPSSSWLFDAWVVLMLVMPIYGCLYPLESYLSLGQGDGLDGFANLPVPITSITLVIITATVGLLYAKVHRVRSFQHDFLAYGFIALAIASALWSAAPTMTVLQRSIRLVPSVGLALALPQFYRPRKLMRLATIAMLIAMIVSFVLALGFPSLGLARLGKGYQSAWRGAFVHKNLAGMIAGLGVIVTYGAWRIGAVRPWLGALTGGCCVVMLAMSESGTGVVSLILAAVATAATVAVQSFPKRLRMLATALTLVLLVAGALIAYLSAQALLDLAHRDVTLTGRTVIWDAVWKQIQAHPLLGQGWGFWLADSPTRALIWREVGDTAVHSHNSWLDVWLQLGIFGLIAAAGMTMGALFRASSLLLRSDEPEVPIMMMIIAFLLVRSMTEVEFTDPGLVGTFFLVWPRARLRQIAAERRILSAPWRPQADWNLEEVAWTSPVRTLPAAIDGVSRRTPWNQGGAA